MYDIGGVPISRWNRERLSEAERELERMKQRVTWLYPAQNLESRDSPVTVIALTRYVDHLKERIAEYEAEAA